MAFSLRSPLTLHMTCTNSSCNEESTMDTDMSFPMDSQAKPQIAEEPAKISREQMLAEFASSYKRMAE